MQAFAIALPAAFAVGKNLVKIGHAVPEISIQIDRHTHHNKRKTIQIIIKLDVNALQQTVGTTSADAFVTMMS